MLPLPELDNEKYVEIVDEAIQKIPGLTSEWTDFNYHDPGISLLQLLAWLKEMQQFYIDAVGDTHRLKHLKLLGCKPLEAAPACADILFWEVPRQTLLPAGTKLDASGICFETGAPLMLLDNEIASVISMYQGVAFELTGVIGPEGTGGEYVFGPEPGPGDAILLGFSKPLPGDLIVSLLVTLTQRKEQPVRRNPDKPLHKLADMRWEYWNGSDWCEAELMEDKTEGFIIDGYIRLKTGGLMQPSTQVNGTDSLYWLRCVLTQCHYDIAPHIDNISINCVQAYQKDTFCEFQQFDGTGEDQQSFVPGRLLQMTGRIEVQVYEDGWWRTCYRTGEHVGRCKVLYDENDLLKEIVFSSEYGCVPAKAQGNIRLISWTRGFENKRIVAGSNGYPLQEYETGIEMLLADSFEIQVGKLQDGEMFWRDWKKTEDLLTAGPEGAFYELDAKAGIIRFGDGENGEVPPRGENNIRMIACATTYGSGGNVRNHEISSIAGTGSHLDEVLSGIRILNKRYAHGGRDLEPISDAILRFRKSFDVPQRAVTAADYEQIIMTTPGLMIDMARALPGHAVNLQSRGISECANCVTVVVKPYSADTPMPTLNKAYRKNLLDRLERYRMITTQVDVISPRYFGMDVYCMVVVKPYFKDAQKDIQDFFNENLGGAKGGIGFGTGIIYGNIYGKLESLDCVEQIVNLSIEPHESGVYKKAGGDIDIPLDGLIYLRSVTVNIKEHMR